MSCCVQEDLPTFLSLLRPGGRMVVVIEEEALLVTRPGQDPHDFSREVRACVRASVMANASLGRGCCLA